MRKALTFAVAAGLLSAVTTAQTVIYELGGYQPTENFGYSVAGGGDVNGDGFADVIVGTTKDDSRGIGCGSVRVFSGRTGAEIHAFYGDSAGDRLGSAVGHAGDVDGDGFADIIAAAEGDDDDTRGLDCGSARVFSGRTGAVLHSFFGDSAGDGLKLAVDGAGDVNADGYDDLIVGYCKNDDNGSDSGVVRLYSGKTGSALYTFRGDRNSCGLGCDVSSAGDVDGDGFDDVIVATYSDQELDTDAGTARVYSGRTGAALHIFRGSKAGDLFSLAVSGVGDIDGDGYDDVAARGYVAGDTNNRVVIFSGRSGQPLHTLLGTQSTWRSFGYSIDGAGDVDGDGYDDLVVGAPYQDDPNPAVGSPVRPIGCFQVYSGHTGAVLSTVWGSTPGLFPISKELATGAGDVDGDGYADIVAGAANEKVDGLLCGGHARIYSLGGDGTPAQTRAFGHGCAGSNGDLPRIDCRGRPGLDESVDFLLRGARPKTLVALIIGDPVNIDLGNLWQGLAGCRLYAPPTQSVTFAITDGHGMASLSSPQIPKLNHMIGWRLNAQWACLDPDANPFGIVGSDALALTVGD